MIASIACIAGAFTTDPKQYQWLRKSADKFNVPLRIFGKGESFPDTVGQIQRLRSEFMACTGPYVLFTDAYDTLFCRWDADEVIERIDMEPSGLVISCESECWPPGPWCDAYKGGPFINGGQYCGKKDALIALMERMLETPDTQGGSTQERLHRMFADGYPMSLDRERRIFCSMSGGYAPVVEAIYAYHVGSIMPMMLHFNGRTDGIETWGARCLG